MYVVCKNLIIMTQNGRLQLKFEVELHIHDLEARIVYRCAMRNLPY
jgi:hypothetical protein